MRSKLIAQFVSMSKITGENSIVLSLQASLISNDGRHLISKDRGFQLFVLRDDVKLSSCYIRKVDFKVMDL